MGEHDVRRTDDEESARRFTEALLGDLRALETMLASSAWERGPARIGAEQEMFLVGPTWRPAPVAPAILERAIDPRLTPEIARFNLEANLTPRLLGGSCLRDLHDELREILALVRAAAAVEGARVALCGILPTLVPSDLGLGSLSPGPRYAALNDAILRERGGEAMRVRIEGTDEIEVEEASVMLESCNTSFQLHLQVDPAHFAALYNVTQAITPALLAAAAGSPLLFDKRLCRETRIALFAQSVDDRHGAVRRRGAPPRVGFGDAWVRDSPLELFREDALRHRAMLSAPIEHDSEAALARGEVPELRALRLHGGTVWRWNRPVVGIGGERPHLRIENRVLCAGPSLTDEVANAALFYGLVIGAHAAWGDPASSMPFAAAREGFRSAARGGLGAEITLPDGTRGNAATLLLDRLLPLAREGLREAGVDDGDARHYLGVIEERVRARRTLARWMLDAHAELASKRAGERSARITEALVRAQEGDAPVHTWPGVAEPAPPAVAEEPSGAYRLVRQVMTSDLFTVRASDAVGLAASIMSWRHVRHVPVEDDAGRLVGIVTHRALIEHLAKGPRPTACVRDLMKSSPITVTPDTATLEAVRLMREKRVSGLPVVEGGRLVGLITEHDLLAVSADLLERLFG